MIHFLQHRSSATFYTGLLLVGLVLGYASFVIWLGLRPIVLLSGAAIVGMTLFTWYRQLAQPVATSANLLQPEVFISQLNLLGHPISETQPQWQSVQQQALTIQKIASQIAQQEAALIPDLLETLHTVLELVKQRVEALQVTQQVQTDRYRILAQQRLQSSQVRLHKTQEQLQALFDQIAVDRLEPAAAESSGMAQRLQILIAENEKEILGD